MRWSTFSQIAWDWPVRNCFTTLSLRYYLCFMMPCQSPCLAILLVTAPPRAAPSRETERNLLLRKRVNLAVRRPVLVVRHLGRSHQLSQRIPSISCEAPSLSPQRIYHFLEPSILLGLPERTTARLLIRGRRVEMPREKSGEPIRKRPISSWWVAEWSCFWTLRQSELFPESARRLLRLPTIEPR